MPAWIRVTKKSSRVKEAGLLRKVLKLGLILHPAARFLPEEKRELARGLTATLVPPREQD